MTYKGTWYAEELLKNNAFYILAFYFLIASYLIASFTFLY